MVSSSTLTTPRLRLRPFGADDAARLPALCGAFEVSRLCMKVPHPYSEVDARFFLEHVCTTASSLTLAIVHLEDDELMGCVSLDGISAEEASASIGYWLGRQFWGHGYATEAARAIVSHGFSSLGLERIHGSHFVDNSASCRVMAKVGFVATGVAATAACMARGGLQLPTLGSCLTRDQSTGSEPGPGAVDGPSAECPSRSAGVAVRRSCWLRFSDPYVQSLVRQALVQSGWQAVEEGAQRGEQRSEQRGEQRGAELQWGDFGRLEWDDLLAGLGVGCAYYLKSGLVRKTDLHFYLTKHAARSPASAIMDSLPTTCAAWRRPHVPAQTRRPPSRPAPTPCPHAAVTRLARLG